MLNLSYIVKLYNLKIAKFFPGFIRKILLKRNNITFIPTELKNLPVNNYPTNNSIKFQKDLIEFYEKTQIISSNSYPNLKNILRKKYNTDSYFNFLDFGGDKIDFYLDISKNFKNIKYFLMNQKKINNIFVDLKKKYNYENLIIINDLSELKKFSYDFVFFGSTLQYLNDYKNILSIILPLTNQFILFSATHFYTSNQLLDKIVVKQLNFLPTEHYLYFLNLVNFLNILKSHGFIENFNQINENFPTNFATFNNLNLYNISYRDIFFKKN
jgi:hypothetical protein